MRSCLVGTAVAVFLAIPAVPRRAVAQAVGALTGRVIDKATEQPIGDAQVSVLGTVRVARTGADGRYRISEVPAGSVTIRVLRLGYQQGTANVTVLGAQSATADFALVATATTLDVVTITATGEQQRSRERAAAVSRIDSSSFNVATVTNVSQVLAARTPGVVVQQGSGTSGTGSRIRLRGGASLSLQNDPLLIVDGVLLNNNTSGFTIGIGGAQVSRFDDINPEDIENIEVIKGPAATALYGTGAGNGVIQITTKRGKAGAPRWSVYSEQGQQKHLLDLNDPVRTVNYRQIGRTPAGARANCSIESQVRQLCRPDTLYTNKPFLNDSPFRSGARQSYGASVSGGSPDVQYFLAGDFDRDEGIFPTNTLTRLSLRSNLSANVMSSLNAQANINYIRSGDKLPLNDNLFAGTLSAGLLGSAFDCNPQTWKTIAECAAANDSLSRGYVTANVPVTQYFALRQTQELRRLLLGSTVSWTPRTWLRGTAQAGADMIEQHDESLTPPNRVFLNLASIEGSRQSNRSNRPTYSATGSLAASFDAIGGRFTTTGGANYQDAAQHTTVASGAVLLSGTASLNGTNARFNVGEGNSRSVTVGGFVEERAEFADRLFINAGVRTDDASVFGNQSGGWVYYPFGGVSYVVSEEPWMQRQQWLEWMSTLRVRAAFGRSSQRPNFRQSETFYSPVAVNVSSSSSNEAAVTLGGPVGNPGLRPELTDEIEGGFEMGLFGRRLMVDLTGFRRTTRNLLVQRTLAPSLGASANQFLNLSKRQTHGLEALVTAKVLTTRWVGLDQTLSFTTLRDEIEDLGEGIAPIVLGRQQHRAGFPAGGFFDRKIRSYTDLNNDGMISRVNCPAYGGLANPQLLGGPRCEIVLSDSLEYLGSPIPTRELSLMNNITIGRHIVVMALVNYRGGVQLYNNTREFRNNGGFANGPDFWDRNAPLSDQVKSAARGMGTSDGYIEDASFVRLSELSATFTSPQRWARTLRMSGASLTLAARNVALWTDYTGFDPEVLTATNANFGSTDFLTNPPTRRFTTRVTLTF